jgi:hypothetical protein
MHFKYDYVCIPNNFRIIAEKEKGTSKGIRINFLINNKTSLSLTHSLPVYTPTEQDINEHVARCCTFLKETTENYIQDRIDENYIMGALNFHRSLIEVCTKNGRCIWWRKAAATKD